MLRIIFDLAAPIGGFHRHIRPGRQDLKFRNPLTVLRRIFLSFKGVYSNL